MSGRIRVVTREIRPYYYRRRGTSGELPRLEKIVGVTPPGAATCLEYGYRVDGHELERELNVGAAASRILEFYERTRARPPVEVRPYDCHTFVFYALGKIVHPEVLPEDGDEKYDAYPTALQTPQGKTEIGKGYCLFDRQAIPQHSFLGAQDSDHNVSILGEYGPLAITQNADLLKCYGGTVIRLCADSAPLEPIHLG